MSTSHETEPAQSPRVATQVRARVLQGGERLWSYADFQGLPFGAVAQALSRLKRNGDIERLSRGTYYRPRHTPFGQSRPNPAALQHLVSSRTPLFPAGLSAASLLGFTTQVPRKLEFSTSAQSLAPTLLGPDTVVHTRRPAAWTSLTSRDAAMLDFLRNRGRFSELAPEETVRRALDLLSDAEVFARLVAVSVTEPARVRAMLGAFGEQLRHPPHVLNTLRASLNSLSQFDFGAFAALPTARHWQAHITTPRAAV